MRSLPRISRRGLPRSPDVLANPAVAAVLAAIFTVLAAVALLALLPTSASARDRDIVTVDGKGSVPAYRPTGAALLVCPATKADFDERVAAFPDGLRAANVALFAQCQTGGYHTLQAAVDNAKRPGTTIKILPGVYLEEPSLAAATPQCPGTEAVLSYGQQVACPHSQNLVAVLGKQGLQIEGTGAKPEDVIIDGQYKKLNGIRADRSPGIYLRNFTVQRTAADAVYVMESDGFVIDNLIGRWNSEHGFQAFADDHGLYTACQAYGNGDAGISVSSAANINAANRNAVDRYAVEIRGCTSQQNLLGYSGSAGNSVWAHDNTFNGNTVGVSTDSAAPDQSGLPQNHTLFEKNIIAANNTDYYRFVRDGTCRKAYPDRGYENGVVCPVVGVPVGTGVISTGGNDNIWRDNWVYDNAYAGFVSTWVPGFVREDTHLGAQFDTSHHNRYYANTLGVTKDGSSKPNGMDFWWDGQGVGSCWQHPSGDGAEPRVLPACGAQDLPAGFGTSRYVGEPGKLLKLFACSNYDQAAQRIPSDCDWYGARGLGRIEVKYALGEAVLLGLVLLILWWRLLGGSRLAFGGLALALSGLVVGVYGTLNETTPLTAIGLVLVGLGWLCVGVALRRRGRRGLGWLCLTLAVFALLGGVDRGVFMVPWIPVAPSVVRIMLEAVWVPAALVAAGRGRMLAVTRTRPDRPDRRGGKNDRNGGKNDRGGRDRRGPSDPLERFAAALRD